jgi:hypothetical protein
LLLEVLEATVESAYTRNKQQSLQRANLRLEVARHLWRLSHEFQAIPIRSYEHGGARLMDDHGRQLGGWLRSLSAGALSQ